MKQLASMCLVSIILLSSVTAADATKNATGEVWEVLYYWGGERAETQKIGALGAVKLDQATGDRVSIPVSDLRKLTSELDKFIDGYLSQSRRAVSVRWEELQRGQGPVKTVVLYEVRAGRKGSDRIDLGAYDPSSSLDKSKVYAVLPLLAGYDCNLVHVAFVKDQWVFQGIDGKSIAQSECKSKELDHWVVGVEVLGVTGEGAEKIKVEMYDSIDRAQTYRQKLKSFRRESEEATERNRNTPPMAQVGFSRAHSNFILKLSVE